MYPLRYAAAMLGISQSTLRSWITQTNIPTIKLPIDGERVYIKHQDLIELAATHQHKIAPVTTLTNRPKNHPDPDLYTLAETAQCLDVSLYTLRIWLTQHNISKKLRITDKRRTYIEEQDVLQLANLHARKPKTLDLCSIKEAAQYLGVSSQTVVIWLEQHNILTHIIGTTGQR